MNITDSTSKFMNFIANKTLAIELKIRYKTPKDFPKIAKQLKQSKGFTDLAMLRK